MGGLLAKAKRFASSRQGKQALGRAQDYARSEKGRRQIASVRERFAGARGKGRKGL